MVIDSLSTKVNSLAGLRLQCVCDCGNEFLEIPRKIIKGERKTCGKSTCPYKIELNTINGNKSSIASFSGYEEIYGAKWSQWRLGAQKRNLEWKITIEDAWDLFLKQNRKCALSGVTLTFGQTWKDSTKGYTTASLDRKDSSKGYTLDNVQWVHKVVNVMKNSLTDEELIEWCKKIVEVSNESD